MLINAQLNHRYLSRALPVYLISSNIAIEAGREFHTEKVQNEYKLLQRNLKRLQMLIISWNALILFYLMLESNGCLLECRQGVFVFNVPATAKPGS